MVLSITFLQNLKISQASKLVGFLLYNVNNLNKPVFLYYIYINQQIFKTNYTNNFNCIVFKMYHILILGGYIMKDGLICGMLVGLVAGALLYKHNPQAKELVNNSEKAVKKELKNISSK